MLVKEYRICLPMSVDEYRIAQLYMIQRKSREESSGTESGVEILINEPYEDGPGGSGQYTQKIYHVGGHLPSWFRAILPKSALQVEEEAWNAYPYTKTIYRCPFIQKFMLEIETCYFNDAGEQDNVFNLVDSDKQNRIIDYLDIVRDQISGADYKPEEDPTLFHSTVTRRGPLSATWRDDYARARHVVTPDGGSGAGSSPPHLMCAYKLCKVEFRYWGMQSKIERFIHDIGLRKTMLRAHRQAWCWQDEYHGLTMADIRQLERDTQLALQKTMMNADETETDQKTPTGNHQVVPPVLDGARSSAAAVMRPRHDSPVHKTCVRISAANHRKESWASATSNFSTSGSDRTVCNHSFDNIEKLRTSVSDDDEFYDAHEDMSSNDISQNVSLMKASSLEMLTPDEKYVDTLDAVLTESSIDDMSSPLDRRLEQYRCAQNRSDAATMVARSVSSHVCNTTVLFVVLHGGSIMDCGQDVLVKQSDVTTLRSTFTSVVQAHYPTMLDHIAVRAVPCPAICSDTISLLTSLNPSSFDNRWGSNSKQDIGGGGGALGSENFPLSAVPLFAAAAPEYTDAVSRTVLSANRIYAEFLRSDEGAGFNGQVCLIGDSVGSLLAYDALCKPRPGGGSYSRGGSISDTGTDPDSQPSSRLPDDVNEARCTQGASCPGSRKSSTGSQCDVGRFDFDVTDFFMFGSPLALLLAYRRRSVAEKNTCTVSQPQFLDPLTAGSNCPLHSSSSHSDDSLLRPSCLQLYNLFYVSDPLAIRMEPLLADSFSQLPPVSVPRYAKFPLGDGLPVHVVETLQANSDMFRDLPQRGDSVFEDHSAERRPSTLSMLSETSGQGELTTANISSVTNKWWGTKRLDYVIYCPEALQSFPNTALPYLLHASFWESTDVIAFILRQVVRQEYLMSQNDSHKETVPFSPSQPREKWLKRRTTIKLRNVAPNHRANDVIIAEGKPQILVARFMYGPLDMVSLSTEKVDVHIMTNPPDAEWIYFGTEVTDSNGRVTFTIPEVRRLGHGMYPVKMVVRGDHTCVDFYLTVVLPKAETVVFSIDGAFAASVSIMGKDPKVQPGAVDVARHWQDLGYLLLYVTARPDMQHKRVVAWLAQHNFPHGAVAFMDGLRADPLRQKAKYLEQLIQEADILLCAGYGSSKDIWVYQSVSLPAESTYIVGKVPKKHQKSAVVLSDGYAAHLTELVETGRCEPATTNARMQLRKACFSLPGQKRQRHPPSRQPVRKTISLPPSSALNSSHNGNNDAVGGSLIQHSTSIRVTDTTGSENVVQYRHRGLSPRGRIPH